LTFVRLIEWGLLIGEDGGKAFALSVEERKAGSYPRAVGLAGQDCRQTMVEDKRIAFVVLEDGKSRRSWAGNRCRSWLRDGGRLSTTS
jgi:hypothetical protein